MLKNIPRKAQLDHIAQHGAAEILRDLCHRTERRLWAGKKIVQILHASPGRRLVVGIDIVPAVDRRIVHHTGTGVDALRREIGAVAAQLLIIVEPRIAAVGPVTGVQHGAEPPVRTKDHMHPPCSHSMCFRCVLFIDILVKMRYSYTKKKEWRSPMNTAELSRVCRQVRRDIINMTANAGSGHPGGSLSAVELMVSTFYNHMRVDPKNPKAEDRDRFVLSKGHAAPCYYAVLAELGFISRDEFKNFRQLHSILQGHPDCKKVPGVDASTGSLGQGCSIAVGMALGAKLQGKDTKVFTLLGDGECQEGQIWEALMSAAHYKLDNLTVMVDNNGLQIDGSNNEVMSLGDLAAKLRAFGFDLYEIDGHDLDAVEAALSAPAAAGKPKAILAHTVKGKGVSFMENQVGWHGKAPNEEQRQQALKELED